VAPTRFRRSSTPSAFLKRRKFSKTVSLARYLSFRSTSREHMSFKSFWGAALRKSRASSSVRSRKTLLNFVSAATGSVSSKCLLPRQRMLNSSKPWWIDFRRKLCTLFAIHSETTPSPRSLQIGRTKSTRWFSECSKTSSTSSACRSTHQMLSKSALNAAIRRHGLSSSSKSATLTNSQT